VWLDVHNSETTDQAKDGSNKSFEVPSAWESQGDQEPKSRGEEEDLQNQGWSS
jgi:hypothetical protein